MKYTPLLLVFLTGCLVTSDDLRSLSDEMRLIGVENAATAEGLANELDLVADQIDERVATPAVPITGNPLIDVILTAGGMAAGAFGLYKKTKKDAVVTVNHERDVKRVERGEQV